MVQDIQGVAMAREVQKLLEPIQDPEVRGPLIAKINELVAHLNTRWSDAEGRKNQLLQEVMVLRGILGTVQEAVTVVDQHPNSSQS